MGSLFGGKSDLFYNQFELYNREQKVTQIILLKDAIFRIKMTFNKEFDEVLNKKEQELSKVSIQSIYTQSICIGKVYVQAKYIHTKYIHTKYIHTKYIHSYIFSYHSL